MKRNSLAVRLAAGATVWSVAVLLAGGLILSSLFRTSVEDNFDARLFALLESLVATTEVVTTEAASTEAASTEAASTQVATAGLVLTRPLAEPLFDQAYSGWYWQIEAADGSTTLRSRSLFDQALPPAPAAGPPGRYAAPGPDNQSLRVVTRTIVLPAMTTPFQFRVGADTDAVERQIRRFNRTLAWALGLLGLGLVSAVLIQVRFGLQPLRRIGVDLAAIRLGRARRLAGTYPAEVAPLAAELNNLIDHNAAVVERARTHVGNLAHALKTPLSVLANEAHTGQAQGSEGALAQTVTRQTDQMRRLVDRHLARARTAATRGVLGARTDVGAVASDVARAVQRIHAESAIDIATACPPDLAFAGESEDLEEMVGNLLDNAAKWARSRVRLSARPDGRDLAIRIEDDGPGLPADQYDTALRRGARLDERVPGSGLGLAIVRDIAELYGGALVLEAGSMQGLCARLRLPAAPTQEDH